MKNILVLIIFIFSMYAEYTEKLLDVIENDLKCTKQYRETSKIEECIKKKIEKIINSSCNKKQFFVFSNKQRAEKKAQDLNCTFKKKNFKGHPKLVDGDYYIVYCKSKITININNKILKNMPDDRVKILKAKMDCFTKYKNKKQNKLIECLEKESINAIQIHALPNKNFCEEAKKKCDEIRKCQCIEKNVNGEIYYTVVETIESSKKNIIKKIKQKKSEPFKLKKPEIFIPHIYR
jgi:Txe/YoeB family toxin of Txe-Axe toxin-antitoxin module